MDHEKKRRIAYEVLVLLGVLVLLTFVVRLWPILLLVMLAIIVCALRLLFLKAKTVEVIAPATPPPEPPPHALSGSRSEHLGLDTEISLVQKAFGLLQRRITEQVELQYPGARWIWGIPNAIERFKNNEPLIVLLNGAGGYQKAQVQVHNLLFKGLYYRTAPTQPIPPMTPAEQRERDIDLPDDDDETDGEVEDIPPDDVPINYGRLAFEWVDANMMDLGAKYNEAIAAGLPEMLIPSEDLPHPDSWTDVCEELKRNGFSVADFCEDGIRVNITP